MKLVTAVILLALIYFVQKFLFRKYWYKGLDAKVYFDRDYIECGESAKLIETVTNNKFLPLPVFHLKFSVDKKLRFLEKENSKTTDLYHKNELFSILGHQRIKRSLEFVGKERGVVCVRNANILVRDFFLTDMYAAQMKHMDTIYVFPKKINTERFKLYFKGILGELESRKSVVEDSLSFRGVRPYQPFDPYRSINWKQSAKVRELMVNMYGYTTDSRVRIMLNLDNDYMIETNKLLEEAISLTSSIARQLINKGVMVSVVTNGRNKDGALLTRIEEGAEKKHSITIDKMLCEITGSEGKDRFLDYVQEELRAVRTDTLYLVISPYAKPDLMCLLDGIEEREASVKMIVPYYDEYPYVPNRHYSTGWEVPLNV